jgi:hypothetical protein
MKKTPLIPILILIITILSFFYPLFLNGKLPIPSDTIIGLYHPFRDLYAQDYPNGIPYKNNLITDPVRQQYPWKSLAITTEKNGQLPLWNPYTMAGTPHLANMQSSAFYPLNLLLFLPDLKIWWSLSLILQPLLAGIFMYLYLQNLNLKKSSSFLGGFVFAFCGFSIAWLEWGNIGHVALWLPLALLSIDKIFQTSRKILWSIIFLLALTFSFFAGHLQIFFYLYILTTIYFLARWFFPPCHSREGGNPAPSTLLLFIILNSCFIILTLPQWLPTLQFIQLSARDIDQATFQATNGWFLPPQHLIQFFAPDFFGNPATLNYWGIWNYGEFIGYIGIFPLLLAIFALFYRYDKKTLFFGSIFFLSLIFALPTLFAKIPYILDLPLISTSQPTRLMFLTDFSLSVLAALGLDFFCRTKEKKRILLPLAFMFLVYLLLWTFVLSHPSQNTAIAKNNLYLPTLTFIAISALIMPLLFFKIKNKLQITLIFILIAITILDLFRFAYKFTPFTQSNYLFPPTKSLTFLQSHAGNSRIMTTDARILPPNFSIFYNLQSIDGYDPLYSRNYAELIAAMERNNPDINSPFGFNRIINPHNYDSKITDLLGVKYILSLSDLHSPKLTKVFEEGQTKIYENKKTLNRAFFVNEVHNSKNKQQTISAMFDPNINLKNTAIVENWNNQKTQFPNKNSKAKITSYTTNKIQIKTSNAQLGFLVLTDSFYPTWHAKICNINNKCFETKIYLTDYNFRGIIIPPGKHTVMFYNTLL